MEGLSIGEILRDYRKEHKLQQKDLAEMLGMKQPQLAAYENGKKNPRVDTLKHIAAVMGITYEALLSKMSTEDQVDAVIFGGTDARIEFGTQIIMENIKKLNINGMQEAIHLIDLLTMIPEYQATKPAPSDNGNE